MFMSAVVHELIFTCSLGIFFPFHTTIFYFSAVTIRNWNWIKPKDEFFSQVVAKVLFLWNCGLFMTVYFLEFRARYSLPVVNNNDTAEYITPRLWSLIA